MEGTERENMQQKKRNQVDPNNAKEKKAIQKAKQEQINQAFEEYLKKEFGEDGELPFY